MLKAEVGLALADRSSGANPPAMPGLCGLNRGGPLSVGYGVTVEGRSYGAEAGPFPSMGGLSEIG
jgi:hypothetical protein